MHAWISCRNGPQWTRTWKHVQSLVETRAQEVITWKKNMSISATCVLHRHWWKEMPVEVGSTISTFLTELTMTESADIDRLSRKRDLVWRICNEMYVVKKRNLKVTINIYSGAFCQLTSIVVVFVERRAGRTLLIRNRRTVGKIAEIGGQKFFFTFLELFWL